jgi:hypothetical protein
MRSSTRSPDSDVAHPRWTLAEIGSILQVNMAHFFDDDLSGFAGRAGDDIKDDDIPSHLRHGVRESWLRRRTGLAAIARSEDPYRRLGMEQGDTASLYTSSSSRASSTKASKAPKATFGKRLPGVANTAIPELTSGSLWSLLTQYLLYDEEQTMHTVAMCLFEGN